MTVFNLAAKFYDTYEEKFIQLVNFKTKYHDMELEEETPIVETKPFGDGSTQSGILKRTVRPD